MRQQGQAVNRKEIRRLMREHDLQPWIRRCFIATTDSDHTTPAFPNPAKELVPNRPNQLWVSDISYVAPPALPQPDAVRTRLSGFSEEFFRPKHRSLKGLSCHRGHRYCR